MLDVAGDGEAGFESAARFFADHVCDYFRGVSVGGVFVAEDQFAGAVLPGVFGEAFAEMLDVSCEHLDGDSFFGCVDCCGADGEAGHGGYVAGSAALGFDDEDAPAGSGGGLFDGVAVADECVETRVAAYGVFCSGDVVADGGGEEHHWYSEGGIVWSCFAEFAESGEGFEAAYDEEGIDFVLHETFGCLSHADFGGEFSVGTDF